jgi:hypothetical protein
MLYDAFICHASEDKDGFVRPLAEALSNHHLAIWYDEFSLNVGDSLRQAIDEGLAKSRFGIVVLSRSFFKKGWAQRELDGLVTRQIAEDRRLILPIWHDIGQREILKVSPPLADMVAINSARGVEYISREIVKKLRPEESPLIAARDELIRYGHEPPVISDEWWLDIIELKETDFSWFLPSRRWVFPLPYSGYVTGRKRGINIAWTAMQLEWSDDAEKRKICQITPPDKVHDFINSYPGLAEICCDHPDYLAGYVPQLLIPEFSGQFAQLFDELLVESVATQAGEAERGSHSGVALTSDGQIPLCDKRLAFRHPTLGNYKPETIADKWMNGKGGSFGAKCFESIEYLIWLLSDHSNWLPPTHRECLITGMRDWPTWATTDLTFGKHKNLLVEKLYEASQRGKSFRFDDSTREALEQLINESLIALGLDGDAKILANVFIERQFVEGVLEFNNRIYRLRGRAGTANKRRSNLVSTTLPPE